MTLLLLTPPMVQLNTAYPATPYLTGFLRHRRVPVVQADPALTWVLKLLAPTGLQRLAAAMPRQTKSPAVAHVLRHLDAIMQQMPIALNLLQNRDTTMAARIAARRYLCEGPRFASIGPKGHEEEYLQWSFGGMGTLDRARYVATLFLEDIADAIRDGVDPHFGFARYGEALAESQPFLDPLLDAMAQPNAASVMLDEICDALLTHYAPNTIGMTLPFPGNVLGALRMARRFKECAAHIPIFWGGGYVNTELRDLTDVRLFDYVDAITYDDGEQPLLNLLDYYAGNRPRTDLLRTRLRDGNVVIYVSSPTATDVPFVDSATPTYDGLPLADYLGMFDVLNPMHRLWSDTRWNKLTVAHGCYWKKCSFCDITLDYIANYAPLAAPVLADRMEQLITETGGRGFHFVDEAAPPRSLKALAEEILRRGLQVSWWANIRFDKTFTPELAQLLAQSGCIAVSGGLEVASNRLLALMQKGVSVEQVARVTAGFNRAGILVHAYLMYGFPSQTEQEIIDSLEMVRQLFDADCLTSAYWHRFTVTVHSPVGRNPDAFGVRLLPTPKATFARNDLPFADTAGCDPEPYGPALHKAVYNYMHGMGTTTDVRAWFDQPVPKPRVPRHFIREALATRVVKQRSSGRSTQQNRRA